MEKFKQFKIMSEVFLAIQRKNEIAIIDIKGNYYGSFYSINSFKKGEYYNEPLGQYSELSYHAICQ